MKAIIIALFLLLFSQAHADLFTGKISRIVDGDTVIVRGQKVRLVAIDSPEMDQDYGEEAKRNMEAFFKKRVVVEYYKRDRYKRIVGKIYYNGFDLGLAQIISGYAWYVDKYEKDLSGFLKQDDYESAQALAKKLKRGLWRDQSPVAPWIYRRRKQ